MNIIDTLDPQQLGRVAAQLGEFFVSGEAQWAQETPMPDQDAAQVLTKALGVRFLGTYANKTGYWGHLRESWKAPEFAADSVLHSSRQCEDQTHTQLEYDGHHIGVSVNQSGRGYEVMAMVYGKGEGPKLAASYWARESTRMKSYMPLKFYGA
jgi:hypothetical protein